MGRDGGRVRGRAKKIPCEWVSGEELEAKLKKELSRQMVWTVYLEADSDCPFMNVVQAIDTIQGLGAKLVWVTPKTREEWSHKSTPCSEIPTVNPAIEGVPSSQAQQQQKRMRTAGQSSIQGGGMLKRGAQGQEGSCAE